MTIFSDVGSSISGILSTFVSTTSSNLIGGLQGTVMAATTLYFVVFGYMVMGGYVQNTIMEFTKKALTIALILGLAFTAAAYQSNVVESFQGLETGLSSLVQGGNAGNIFQVLDTAFTAGIDLSEQSLDKANSYSLLTSPGAVTGWLFNCIVIFMGTLLLTVVAAGFVMLAKVALAILLGVGPLFILCLMFPAVRRFFDAWAGQVVTYTLVIVFMAVVMAFGTAIFQAAVNKAQASMNTGNMLEICAQLLVVSACLIIIALQIPSLASSLGGGVGLSMLNPLHPASSAYNVLRRGGGRVYNAVNGQRSRRDMSSGLRETKSRVAHIAAGNTILNPAYNRRNWDNLRSNWGKSAKSGGGRVDKV